MQLISEQYRKQQEALHAAGNYGVASAQWAKLVSKVVNQYNVKDLLDYGAGSKLTLIRTISDQRLVQHEFKYRPYEPAVEQYSKAPDPAEMVTCIDVLEHIEPELLDNVLDDLKRVTKKIGFFTVSCIPAMKVLPDGRNAHLIQQPPEWWLPKIMSRFELHTYQVNPEGFMVLVAPKDDDGDLQQH